MYPNLNKSLLQAARRRVMASDFSSPFRTPDGEIHFNIRDVGDLEDEEYEGYLPDGIESVLEISTVQAAVQGKGHGSRLMKAFLAHPRTKEFDALYLDPSPLMTSIDGKKPEGDEEEILDNLQRFYSRFGFRNRSVHARMWIFNHASIPLNQYPV